MQVGADGFYDAQPASKVPASGSGLIKSFHTVEVTLADQQADPDSPLFSIKTFEELGLHEDLLKGLYDIGFSKPSKIQERALPLLLKEPPTNMIGQSQSGTGKTAAFVLTMLSRVDFTLNATQALCVAPTRELVRQIHSNIVAMGKFTPVQCELAIKDYVPTTSGADNKIHAHIVVGTPGTLLNILRRSLDSKHVKVLVLDEADNMLDQDGLGDQTTRLKNMLPKGQLQLILFSATFADRVRDWAKKFAPNANAISLKQEELSVANIKQYYMDIRQPEKSGVSSYRGKALREAKIKVLIELYGVLTVAQTIVFCESREDADAIVAAMRSGGDQDPEALKAKHAVQSLHAGKSAEQPRPLSDGDMSRDQIIDAFRAGEIKVLITTNVLARGIDVLQVSLVINFDMPFVYRHNQREGLDIETYLHRIGRTGRFGKKGKAINFVHDSVTWNQITEIEQALGTKIESISSTPPEGVSLGEHIDEQLNSKKK